MTPSQRQGAYLSRILSCLPLSTPWHVVPLRPAVEGIHSIGLPLPDPRHLHRERRDHHMCKLGMLLSLHWLTQPLQLAWGPLSFLAVVGILRDWHSRHVVQVIVCTAHVYGVALYYLTNWNESRVHGVAYSRPETLYFWIYYVGFNLPWAIVPLGELDHRLQAPRLT